MALAAAAVVTVLLGGTVGYRLLGFGWLEAAYQTVTTVTTVGFREVRDFGPAEMAFTIALILVGVGTVLYTITAMVGLVIEGDLLELVGRRRMDRKISTLSGHVVLCGWGRVGQAVGDELAGAGRSVVMIDIDAERLSSCPFPALSGDATSDDVLRRAGIERAAVLVAALASDADNLFVTLSGRALNPGLFIVARARQDASVDKLARAGADRVVNPQRIGGARMAAFVVHPNVAEFLDVVMHEHSLEFRLGEVYVPPGSALVGAAIEDLVGGARVLARRCGPQALFQTSLDPSTAVEAGDVLIAVGTDDALAALALAVSAGGAGLAGARRETAGSGTTSAPPPGGDGGRPAVEGSRWALPGSGRRRHAGR